MILAARSSVQWQQARRNLVTDRGGDLAVLLLWRGSQVEMELELGKKKKGEQCSSSLSRISIKNLKRGKESRV